MATFEQLFPTFIQKCADLHALLRLVTFGLFIVGTIVTVAPGFTTRGLLLHLVRLVILMSLLMLLPTWGNQVQDVLQSSILDGLGVDPSKVQEQYQNLLEIKRDQGPSEKSWWLIIADLRNTTIEAIVSVALWLLGVAAALLLFWAYIFQKVILFTGYALSPLLIGFMAIPGLRGIGSKYLLNLSGVLLWPLGWAMAALVTQAVLDFMTDPATRFYDPTATVYRLQALVGLAVVAFWILFSTVAAPLAIQRVVSHGTLAGADLLYHAGGGFLQTTATTAGAAAVASGAGLPLVTAGAAGLAAGLSTISTAAGLGSAGAIIIAGSGLPPRSARGRPGDDITGDRAVRELLARESKQYY
ncbi:MAG: hypothetical protein JNK85_25685 [Verrucomicrobiales bacterium]|nr:hypothetical protein [Verrucomicrobiales bacterium]